MAHNDFKHLLSPGRIGRMELKNRIVLAPMGTLYAEADGSCGPRLLEYYEARARGGAGLIISETAAADWPNGAGTPHAMGFGDERFLPGLKALVERCHRHGARIAAQINHSGKHAQEDVASGRPVMVPGVPPKLKGQLMRALTRKEMGRFVAAAGPDGKGPRYHPMTAEDIQTLVGQFSRAAAQAREAGFDAIEIHAGHGYVIASFLSPFFNTRTDEYGGSVENRARLLLEIVAGVREAVGAEMPLLVRIDAHEYGIEGGITVDVAAQTARLLEAAGVDAIDVSGYGNGLSGKAFTQAPLVHEPGALLPYAAKIRKAVTVPVIGVGRVEMDEGEQAIADGRIDFLALGRKLLADPDLPNRLAAGQPGRVRPCIYCYVCVSQIFLTSPMACAVNPACGREAELEIQGQSDNPKRAVVVGGGPAGMEAARVLSERGHQVTLLERERELGGTARIAALPYEPNERLVTWLTGELDRLPVDIRLGTDATPETLAALNPDHVLVASGASRKAPPIPGGDADHVYDGERLRGLLLGGDADAARGLSLWQRLMVRAGRLTGLTRRIGPLRRLSHLWMPLGKRVAIIGGGLVGLELAEFLAERGRKVTVLEPSGELGAELAVVRRARLLHELREAGVILEKNVEIRQVERGTVRYASRDSESSAPADHVIVALGTQPDLGLAESLSGSGATVTAIGDCHEVGYIEGAMLSARRAALKI